ncbi:MAG: DUF6491 family protein [Rhizomicrobium sp.]
MKKSILLAALGLAVLAAPGAANARCLQLGQIYSWKALDNKTLIVEDDFHDKYKVSLLSYCPQLTFKERLGFKSFGAATRLSCVSAGDDVISRDIGTGPQRCAIKKVEPYTAAMQKADEEAAAAKKAAEEH